MVKALCRSHLWRRCRWSWCVPKHSWSIYSCSFLCHWQLSLWLSVCCSVSESDVGNHTAPPSRPLMSSIDWDHQVSSAAAHDLWQKTERDNIRWTHRLMTEATLCRTVCRTFKTICIIKYVIFLSNLICSLEKKNWIQNSDSIREKKCHSWQLTSF